MKLLLTLFAKIGSFSFAVFIAIATTVVIYIATLLPDLPSIDEIDEVQLNIPLRIYSSDEKLIAEYGPERRLPIALDETPPLLISAILATEDDNFYYHTGVDFPGLVRATIANVFSGSKSQGASTITMQVARNFFLDNSKTYTRKLKEILLSFNIENTLTKDEILELYINKIFLGHRSYGFAAAAQAYYGSNLENLSVPEIAMLAGLPKAPSRDNPITNPTRAKARRDHVLNRLYTLGKIDDFTYQSAKNAPVTAQAHAFDIDLQAPYVAELARQTLYDKWGERVYQLGLKATVTVNSVYQEHASQALRKGLLGYDMRHGYRGPLAKHDISGKENDTEMIVKLLGKYPNSKEIIAAMVTEVSDEQFSALNSKRENIRIDLANAKWARAYRSANSLGPEIKSMHDVVAKGDIVYVRYIDEERWGLSQLPKVSGALVSLDSDTGAILALGGGFDYYLSKFNRATQAKRQPGSNIKPFIYSAALDNGYTPASLVSAAPVVVTDDFEGVWRPQNYSQKFFGPTRLRKALSISLNLVSVRLVRSMGTDTVINHLSQFGFDPDSLPKGLSLSLGSTTVTPLQIASGFAVFSNGGKNVTPYFFEEIIDADGNQYDRHSLDCLNCNPTETQQDDIVPNYLAALFGDSDNEQDEQNLSNDKQAISEQNAFLTTEMLKQVIRTGTGRRAQSLGRQDIAGKTGTTNDFRDAWFSGFSPDVTTTVYIGFDRPKHLGRRESGATAALPIWIDFMKHVLPDYKEQPVVIPEKIVTKFINKDNGDVTDATDPDGYIEYFRSGTEPEDVVRQTSNSDQKAITENLF